VTTDGSIPPGEKPLEAIQRACRMILVEAGLTTVQAAAAAVQGIEELTRGEVAVRSLQDLHTQLATWRST